MARHFSRTIALRVSMLSAVALSGCGGSQPAATSGASGGAVNSIGGGGGGGALAQAGAPAGGAGMTGTAGANTAGANTAGAGGLNPTDCTTPGGTPSGTATGTPGIWKDVSPSALTFDPSLFSNDNFGVQDVLVDPARPSDVYTFVCHQGVWKSTDYGSTWTKVNTGANGSAIDGGKPWGSGIDSNRCRDPNQPPTLYTLNGNGQEGFWKSVDGGVNWQRTQLPVTTGLQYAQDAYSIAVDPYDGKHIVMGFHEAAGLIESMDAGATWIVHTPGDAGVSEFYTFIDTGDASTTRLTWLTIGQSGNMLRTSDGGATWKQVETLQHDHGCSQVFQAGGGVIYAPGHYGTQGDGVYRSNDFGMTWTRVFQGDANNVIGTSTTLYSSYGWAQTGTLDPSLQTTPRAAGMPWTKVAAPAGMTNGAKGSAVTFDGTHHVVITGNWNAGIWRYIEP